eukprot:3699101-Pleurochrysis_carterae.AAC.4
MAEAANPQADTSTPVTQKRENKTKKREKAAASAAPAPPAAHRPTQVKAAPPVPHHVPTDSVA